MKTWLYKGYIQCNWGVNTDLLDSLSANISQLMDSRHTANLINLVQKHNTCEIDERGHGDVSLTYFHFMSQALCRHIVFLKTLHIKSMCKPWKHGLQCVYS